MQDTLTIWLFILSATLTIICALIGWIANNARKRLEQAEKQDERLKEIIQALQIKHAEDKAELAMELNKSLNDGVRQVFEGLNKLREDVHMEMTSIKESMSAMTAQFGEYIRNHPNESHR